MCHPLSRNASPKTSGEHYHTSRSVAVSSNKKESEGEKVTFLSALSDQCFSFASHAQRITRTKSCLKVYLQYRKGILAILNYMRKPENVFVVENWHSQSARVVPVDSVLIFFKPLICHKPVLVQCVSHDGFYCYINCVSLK